MNETFQRILELGEERLALYRLAGKQHLSAAQLDRLRAINDQLPLLWDQHRREYAQRVWGRTETTAPRRETRRAA